MWLSRFKRLRANKAAVATYAIGLPTIGIAFAAAWRDTSEAEFPGVFRWVSATVGVCLFLLFASESYAVLLERSGRGGARSAFLTSQLAKYNPLGGPAQMVSQVALAPGRAADGAQSVLRSKLTAVAGGLIWAPVCAMSATDLPVALRIGIGCAGLGVLAGHPSVSHFGFAQLSRWTTRLSVIEVDERLRYDHARSTLYAAAAAGSLGAAFALFVAVNGGPVTIVAAVSAYALAWTVGYVAIPFPGGIGVREATLVLIAPFEIPDIIVAAIFLRLTQVAVEILLATVGSSLIRYRLNTRG